MPYHANYVALLLATPVLLPLLGHLTRYMYMCQGWDGGVTVHRFWRVRNGVKLC